MNGTHIPVMLEDVVASLRLAPGASVLDATLGLGGHAHALLDATAPSGRLLGIERTDDGVRRATAALMGYGERAVVAHGDFRDVASLAPAHGFHRFDGALFDLGLASWQLDEGYRGLSFQHEAPLDMRVTHSTAVAGEWGGSDDTLRLIRRFAGMPVSQVIAEATEAELGTILRELGGVRSWREVARRIHAATPVVTTGELAAATGSASPSLLAPVFQAFRILVNDEYGAIAAGLTGAWQLITPGGTLAVLSFHSGEHRIVKAVFRALPDASPITRRFPTEHEIAANPRARSATLRYITKQSSTQ